MWNVWRCKKCGRYIITKLAGVPVQCSFCGSEDCMELVDETYLLSEIKQKLRHKEYKIVNPGRRK